MVNATLTRNEYTDWGTFGVLKVKGVAFATVELPWRGNKKKISCIPEGTYICKFTDSKKFKRSLYELQEVPDRSEVKIHMGNWAGDKKMGYRTDSEGCIIIGSLKRLIDEQWGVNLSNVSLAKLHELVSPGDFQLTIQNKQGVSHD